MQRGKKRNRQLDLWVGMPLLNLLATFRRRRRVPPAAIYRIGVICSPALGDTLLFSGPLQDLRAAFPQARIIHFCTKQNFAAAEIIPGADGRVLIDLTKPVDTIRRIRARKLDVLIDFTGWQRLTALYTMLSKAKFTVGFRTPGQRRSRGYDRVVEHTRDRHELENFRALLRGAGLQPEVQIIHEPAIVLAPPAQPVLPEERDIVAFHLWASGQKSWLREWPDERWIELAQRLARPETLFLITGAPSDSERALPFVERMRAAGLRTEPFVSPDGFQDADAHVAAGAAAGQREYGRDAPGRGGGDADRVAERADGGAPLGRARTLLRERPAGGWERRLSAPGLRVRRPARGLHGAHYGGPGGGGVCRR